jgi:hypothetical protein
MKNSATPQIIQVFDDASRQGTGSTACANRERMN